MKFRLSTALLLVGFIAVCVGWVTDRQRLTTELSDLKASRALRDEQIYLGSAIFGVASGKFELFDRFDFNDLDGRFAHINDDPDYRRVVISECVTELLNIYEHQTEVELAGALHNGDWDARLEAGEALHLMKCDETEQFFQTARSLDKFKNPNYYPELHNSKSEEYKSLHRFISDTIAVKDQVYVHGFDDDPREER